MCGGGAGCGRGHWTHSLGDPAEREGGLSGTGGGPAGRPRSWWGAACSWGSSPQASLWGSHLPQCTRAKGAGAWGAVISAYLFHVQP